MSRTIDDRRPLVLVRAKHLGTPRVPTEAQEQAVVVRYLELCKPPVLFCHVPNGGARGRVEAARLVGQGVKRGVPDILIFEARRSLPDVFAAPPIVGVAIEMKRRDFRPAAIRADQRDWLDQLRRRGWHAFIASGADYAIAELQRLGFSPSPWSGPHRR